MSIIENPSIGDLPTYLTREVKDSILVAASLGWRVHVASDGNSVVLHSHDERKRITFGTRRSTPMSRVRREITKYARPDLKEALKRIDTTTDAEIDKTFPTVMDQIVTHDEPPAPAEPVPSHCETWLAGVPHRQHRWYADDDKREKVHPFLCEGLDIVSDLVESSTGPDEPTIISTRVMVAKAGDMRGYDSPTTLERTWSDGTRDYACRLPGCDYHSTGRGAVAAHWARTKTHPLVGIPAEYAAEVPDARKYAPRKARVESLASIIQRMLDAGETDAEKIATEALTWVHEQSEKGTDLAAECDPLTADETLARIRALLDTGERRSLLAENERLVEERLELERVKNQAEFRAEQAEAAAESIREQWQALADLVGTIREERQGA